MTERLTRNNKVNFCFHDEASNMVYYRLQDLEDIMEEYDCNNIEELKQKLKLAHNVELLKYDWCDLDKYIFDRLIDKNLELIKDRDTWQKACELACEREDDCYVYDNIHRAYEFYQQAKKEKE